MAHKVPASPGSYALCETYLFSSPLLPKLVSQKMSPKPCFLQFSPGSYISLTPQFLSHSVASEPCGFFNWLEICLGLEAQAGKPLSKQGSGLVTQTTGL